MRYIGSKINILDFISDSITSSVGHIQGKVFADLFSGTTSVAKYFKKLGCKVISNDYMHFSYLFQVAWIANNTEPLFKGLEKFRVYGYEGALTYLNKINGVKDFIYREYCKEGSSKHSQYERNYFSENNAKKIDAIIRQIFEWKEKKIINKTEEIVLKATLVEAVTKVSNISGTYAAFLKFDEKRKLNELVLRPLDFVHNIHKNRCFNEDVFKVIENVSGDILYLDPPYNQRQYPPYYHLLETISLNDNPCIYGKTGRRPYKEKLSPFCIKNKALPAIIDLIKKASFKHIFLSYNNEGIIPVELLEDSLKKIGLLNIFVKNYRKYKSNGNGHNNSSDLKEIIFYVKK